MTAMLLATKCPYCKTTFKVANDQLKLQSGLVRCGICNQIFNGIEHLAATNNVTNTIRINAPVAAPVQKSSGVDPFPNIEVQSPAKSSPAEHEFDLFDEFKIASEPAAHVGPILELDKTQPQLAETFFPSLLSDEFNHAQTKAEIEAKVQALLDADLQADQQFLKAVDIPDDEPIEEIILEQAEEPEQTDSTEKPADLRSLLGGYSATELSDDDEVEVEDDNDDDDEIDQLTFIRQAKAKKRITLMFSVATILLLLLLAGQATYQFRDLIAAAYPSSKDTLVTLCKLARCQVNLPAQLDAISYEADELHTLARANTFEFSLLMRNHSSLAQAWPVIELTLKDSAKQVVLKRAFNPSEYLANPHDVATGFAANQEQPVKLYFVADQVKASDYVVAIFYP